MLTKNDKVIILFLVIFLTEEAVKEANGLPFESMTEGELEDALRKICFDSESDGEAHHKILNELGCIPIVTPYCQNHPRVGTPLSSGNKVNVLVFARNGEAVSL